MSDDNDDDYDNYIPIMMIKMLSSALKTAKSFAENVNSLITKQLVQKIKRTS